MELHLKDIVSYSGTAYLVEGLVSYRVGRRKRVLARLVDGERVLWMEPLVGELDERVLFLEEVRDLDMTTPPPANILYKGRTYLRVLAGQIQRRSRNVGRLHARVRPLLSDRKCDRAAAGTHVDNSGV